MTSFSNFAKGELIKHYFRTGDITAITVLAHALLTTAANDADTGVFTAGGTGVEVTDAGAYDRVNRAPLNANWDDQVGGDGVTKNSANIDFVTATADWSSGVDIVGLGITNNVLHDNGDLFFHASVTVAKPVLDGDTAQFATGAVVMTWD